MQIIHAPRAGQLIDLPVAMVIHNPENEPAHGSALLVIGCIRQYMLQIVFEQID